MSLARTAIGDDATTGVPNDASRRWHAATADEVLAALESDPLIGLDDDQVCRRQRVHGPNRFQAESKTSVWQVLGRQFRDVLIAILFLAAGISVAVGQWTDAATILAIIVLNGLLGFFQEWKAEQALQALRDMLQPTCVAVRGGQETQIAAAELVPGDVVRIDTGMRIPADLRLLETGNLRIDESALTGESVAVAKDSRPADDDAPLAEQTSMAWMGTAATEGHAVGVVVAIGGRTEFGRIAALTQSIDRDTTPLQRKLAVLGKQLGVAALSISVAIALAGLMTGKPPLQMFLTGVSLAVAIVPEGLPAVATTRAPFHAASSTQTRPTAPPPPWTSTVSPVTGPSDSTASHAVNAAFDRIG